MWKYIWPLYKHVKENVMVLWIYKMLHNAYQEGTTYILHAKLCLILHVLVLPSLTLIENLGEFTIELHVLA